jgi:hypothetical protein
MFKKILLRHCLFGIVLFLILSLSGLFAQGEAQPNSLTPYSLPFAAGLDSLFASTPLYSIPIQSGQFIGAWNIDLSFTVLGDSGNYIDMFYKWGTAHGWGVPYDSLGVDSIYVGRIDSSVVVDGDNFSVQLYLADWWGWHLQGQLVLVPASTLDTVKVKCDIRGQ